MKIALSRALVVVGIMVGTGCGAPGPAGSADVEEVSVGQEALAATGGLVITRQYSFSGSLKSVTSPWFFAPSTLWIGGRCDHASGQTVVGLQDYYAQYVYQQRFEMPCDGKLYRFRVDSDRFMPGDPYVLHWEVEDLNTHSNDLTLVAWRWQN
jgi:hypothetical protein